MTDKPVRVNATTYHETDYKLSFQADKVTVNDVMGALRKLDGRAVFKHALRLNGLDMEELNLYFKLDHNS